MDSLTMQFIKILDDLLESNEFECKKLIFKNIRYNKNDIYYYAKDVLRCLGYSERDDISSMLNKISENNKFTISELYERYSLNGLNNVSGLNQELILKLKQYEMKYVYINKTGLYELILFSEKTEAKPFKNFIFKTLLSTLDDNHQNILSKQKINMNDIIKINNQIFSEIKEIKNIGYSLLNNTEKLYK